MLNLARSFPPLSSRAVALALATTLAWSGAACAQSSTPVNPAGAAAAADLPDTLAAIGDAPITVADLRARIGTQLDQMEAQFRRNRAQLIESTLEEMVRERMLAAEASRQGKTVEEIVAAEAGPSGLIPTNVEITAWYESNQARLGGRTLDQLRGQIFNFLRQQRYDAAVEQVMERLNAAGQVRVYYEPYRFALDNSGAPSLGGAAAPVTVVEFSDFQCPYCRQFAPTLKRLVAEFGDSVRVVYRQFPIPSLHPGAFKAAEASLCAHEQGKFWELHDLMFEEPNRLAVAELKEKARRLNLDGPRFDTCLDTGRYTEAVQRDIGEGERAGVTGTPAVFVNGVFLPGGAVPYETVTSAVRKELARQANQ